MQIIERTAGRQFIRTRNHEHLVRAHSVRIHLAERFNKHRQLDDAGRHYGLVSRVAEAHACRQVLVIKAGVARYGGKPLFNLLSEFLHFAMPPFPTFLCKTTGDLFKGPLKCRFQSIPLLRANIIVCVNKNY